MAKKSEGVTGATELARTLRQSELKNVYLFYGEEDYLKSNFTKIVIGMAGVGEDAVTALDGKITPAVLEEALETSPLLSETQVVTVRDSGIFKGSAKSSGDYSFLAELSGDSIVIFRETEADRNNSNFKVAEACGLVLECTVQPESEVIKLLVKKAAANGRGITTGAILMLFRGAGKELFRLTNEVDRLSMLVPQGGTIDEKCVQEATELSPEARMFDLTDAIAEKNCDKAMVMLRAILADKIPELVVLAAVAKHFQALYNTCSLTEQNYNIREVAENLKIHEYVAKKYVRQVQNYNKKLLAEIIAEIADVDMRCKNSLLDARDGLMILIEDISAK